MSVSLCLSVCMSVCACQSAIIISGTTSPIFTKIFGHATYGRGSVLFRRRSDTLCTSGFIDGVIFAHKPRLLDVAALRFCTRSLGLGYKPSAVILVAGQRTHGTTFRALKVTSQVATPGAESAVYGCVVAQA